MDFFSENHHCGDLYKEELEVSYHFEQSVYNCGSFKKGKINREMRAFLGENRLFCSKKAEIWSYFLFGGRKAFITFSPHFKIFTPESHLHKNRPTVDRVARFSYLLATKDLFMTIKFGYIFASNLATYVRNYLDIKNSSKIWLLPLHCTGLLDGLLCLDLTIFASNSPRYIQSLPWIW